MSETNKSYRIRTEVGNSSTINVLLDQDYDSFDILSVSIKTTDTYRLHNANYGVVVGRVYANGGFGVPNAKVSIFISASTEASQDVEYIYPFSSTAGRDNDGVRYNLLPDEQVSDCHQIVGTFPNKRYLLDNDVLLEVFDNYYKYTTRTNNSGDYIICGVPTGSQQLHMDLDLSDCGILSQRPRDFVYKGYTIEQFENPNQFKSGTEYRNLSQIFTQDQVVNVSPFWGNSDLGETIGITRADMEISFKFEPTCVFIGSVVSDNASQGISKKCIPTDHMGDMDELTTGEGTIEMIRKTFGGSVEEYQVKGTELIDGNGIWCYQIPMNLDYMTTDEYGNMVPTDNPDKGIPTRTRVRFRISMEDMEENTDNYFRAKVLVPHNPQILSGSSYEDYDYEFGTYTRDDSFRDLFWNNVYSVKSYIPRIQKKKVQGWKETKFTGIKHCQDYGANNPIPYNNIRIQMPFMFKVMCILIKIFIKVTALINTLVSMLGNVLSDIGNTGFKINLKILKFSWYPFKKLYAQALKLKMNVIDEGLCPDLENWYFAPMFYKNLWTGQNPPSGYKKYNLLSQTLESITISDDPESVDDQNQDDDDEAVCLTTNTDYLISCIEMNLAQEYKVINFDFYNDWINGLIYFPRWMRYVKKKKRHRKIRLKVKACMDNTKIFSKSRKYTQLCSLGYKKDTTDNATTYTSVKANLKNPLQIIKSNNYHKKRGFTQVKIFGKNGGICHEKATIAGQYVYYLKPCEWTRKTSPANRKVNLFATDIILLGSLNDCDLNGIPQAFKHLSSSSYIMPTNMALTNMETNGPLYAFNDKGTICSKQNQTTSIETITDGINTLDNDSLAAELNFYSGASENYDTQYDDDEESDTIPLTEAAGITWNWAGPGQGKNNKKHLYYPGGHFLGISCVNAQTNIKSCVNLERICEMGTSMSQRKEDVGYYSESDNEASYVYSVPTGLISGDDILDGDFRTMFATMNQNRLIATKLNEDTGYYTYDFSYIRPNNFGGELSRYAQKDEYNMQVDVTDESAALAKYGIASGSTRDDWDSSETIMTQRRTIESRSIDYYMFRFGLPYNELSTVNSMLHRRKFAKEKNGSMYLPQYENSFYFYFGMHEGSTAIDEFNKQFFSECETRVLSTEEANVVVDSNEGYMPCKGTEEKTITIENMEPNYDYTLVNSDGDIVEKGTSEDGVITITLPRDTYTLTVTDNDLNEVTKTIKVGEEYLVGEFETIDFNVTQSANTRTSGELSDKTLFVGGYIAASDVAIPGTEITGMTLYAYADTTYVKVLNGTNAPESSVILTKDGDNFKGVLFLESANSKYDIYLGYKCDGSDSEVKIYVKSCTLSNGNSVDLQIGDAYSLSYNDSAFLGRTTSEDWWLSYSGDTKEDWMIRHCVIDEYTQWEEAFSNNVYTNNGIKAVFGTPQSSTGALMDGKMYTSEDEDEYVGYSVDDDASYTYTYGCSDYNKMKQYYSMSYNGNVVCGDFAGKITDINDTTAKTIEIIDSDRLADGSACIFKPLPYGDLIFGYIDGKKMICLGDFEEGELAVSGVVYPTMKYPVIKRPFVVNANFFRLIGKVWEETTSEGGSTTLSVNQGIIAEKVEGNVHNGLTYEGKYSSSSTMSLYDEISGLTAIVKNDFSGITTTGTTDRVTAFGKYSAVTLDDHSYDVVEGCPSEAISVANEREADIDASMFDYIYYTTENEGYISFSGGGTSDSTVKYYVVINVPEYYFEYGGYIWHRTNKKNMYVYAHYTSAATYDEDGGTCLIHFKDQGSKAYGYIPFTDEDGNVTNLAIKVERGHIFDNYITVENMEKFMKKVFEDNKDKIAGRVEVTSAKTVDEKNITDISGLTRTFVPNDFPENNEIASYTFSMGDVISNTGLKAYDSTAKTWTSFDLDKMEDLSTFVVGYTTTGSGTSAYAGLFNIYYYPTSIKMDNIVPDVTSMSIGGYEEMTMFTGSSQVTISGHIADYTGTTEDATVPSNYYLIDYTLDCKTGTLTGITSTGVKFTSLSSTAGTIDVSEICKSNDGDFSFSMLFNGLNTDSSIEWSYEYNNSIKCTLYIDLMI